jgi:hypothetical protein
MKKKKGKLRVTAKGDSRRDAAEHGSCEEKKSSRAKARRKGQTHSTRKINRDMKYEETLPPEVYEWLEMLRPRTRGECREGLRPCPYFSCKYHLYLDIKKNGSFKLNFPNVEIMDMQNSCSLDIAEQEPPQTLDEIGNLMNLTRERVRQIESRALRKLGPGLAELLADDDW